MRQAAQGRGQEREPAVLLGPVHGGRHAEALSEGLEGEMKCGCVLREASFTPQADLDCLLPESVEIIKALLHAIEFRGSLKEAHGKAEAFLAKVAE